MLKSASVYDSVVML